LGHKKNNLEQMYAIKVMKKTDMINKNMITQGDFFIIFIYYLLIVNCYNLILFYYLFQLLMKETLWHWQTVHFVSSYSTHYRHPAVFIW